MVPEHIPIQSAQGGYVVEFYARISEVVAQLSTLPQRFVVVDQRVAELHREALEPLLAQGPWMLLEADE